MAVAKTLKKRAAAPRKRKQAVVSGMPDGSDVKSRPSTGDDIEAAYEFVKKQKRRTPPK